MASSSHYTKIMFIQGVFQPDLGQHEIMDAAGVLLFNKGGIDEVTEILVHHLCNEGCEGSLGQRRKENKYT